MFNKPSADGEHPEKRKAGRAVSITLGLLVANVVAFAGRPLLNTDNPCTSWLASAYDHGVALDLYGDRPAAIAAYTEDLKKDPDDAEALKNRGYDYVELGRRDLALADLTRALQLQPHDWDLMTRRASVYLQLGQFDRAMTDLTEAVQIAPDVWLPWSSRGDAYLAHGDLDAAVADYTRSLAAGGENHVDGAYLPRGIAYLRAGKFDLAKADFATYAAAHFGDSNAIRGRDCAAQGRNSGDCAIPYPPPTDPMIQELMDAAGRSLSGCVRE